MNVNFGQFLQLLEGEVVNSKINQSLRIQILLSLDSKGNLNEFVIDLVPLRLFCTCKINIFFYKRLLYQ